MADTDPAPDAGPHRPVSPDGPDRTGARPGPSRRSMLLGIGGAEVFFLLPPLLPQAASTPAVPARPATPAMPLRTERRLGCTAASGAGLDGSVSRMAASIACSNSFPRNPPRALKAKTRAG